MESKWLALNWATIGQTALDAVLEIAVNLIVAKILYSGINYLIARLLDRNQKRKRPLLNERKANTLIPLLQNIAFYVICFTVIINILKNVFGIDTGTLLASAGIVGVAVGFGAQSLVKDVIGGFFILFEDQFSVGEDVKLGQFYGMVEEIGLRSTKIRDVGGEMHILPNGSITSVTNYSRGKMRALVEIYMPYSENLEQVAKAMADVGEQLYEDFKDAFVEAPKGGDVVKYGETAVVLRMTAYTNPGRQGEMELEYRRRLYKALTNKGINAKGVWAEL